MKLYRDENLTQEIKENEGLNFGEKIPAGKKYEYSYWIVNETMFENVEIKIDLKHPEVSIKKAPKELKENEKAEIIVEYNPLVDLKKKLNVDFEIIYGEVI